MQHIFEFMPPDFTLVKKPKPNSSAEILIFAKITKKYDSMHS